MKKETLKKIAKPFIFPFAVAIVIWEELFYKPIKYVSNFLERNKVIHKIADKIRNANPYVALLILACCGIPLIPFKMAGLYLVGHGYTLLGLGTFGLAKIVGGAISVQIFNLTEPAIRKIKLINTSLDWTFDKKNKIKKVVTDSPYFISMQTHVREVKANIKNFIAGNTYIQQAKSMFKKKAPVDTVKQDFVTTVVEATIVERITAKVENMSHSVASIIEPQKSAVITKTVETEIVIKTEQTQPYNKIIDSTVNEVDKK